LFGTFCIYLGLNSLITQSASGIGLVGSRSVNPAENFFEYWFVVAIELYVGFLAMKYVLFKKNKGE